MLEDLHLSPGAKSSRQQPVGKLFLADPKQTQWVVKDIPEKSQCNFFLEWIYQKQQGTEMEGQEQE